MAEGNGQRIRVILRMVQIHDNLEPAWDEEGEFRFTAKVSSPNRGGILKETILPPPESGLKFYKVSDNPAWNRLKLDKVLFEGEVDDRLEVEILGEELDFLSPNDQLDLYHRVFEGDPASWVGLYHPGDEGSSDPERMSNWWVYLEIENA
jgi:hypothetical protein